MLRDVLNPLGGGNKAPGGVFGTRGTQRNLLSVLRSRPGGLAANLAGGPGRDRTPYFSNLPSGSLPSSSKVMMSGLVLLITATLPGSLPNLDFGKGTLA